MTRPPSVMPGDRPQRRRAVPASRVVTVALALVVALTGLVGLTELLRHPPRGKEPPEGAGIADPREDLDCPRPEPREGQRPPSMLGPVGPPVEATSAILEECPGTFDDASVHYEGEVVGGLLRREGGTWAQLNDDAYGGDLGPLPDHQVFLGGNNGLAVLLPPALAKDVTEVGGPGTRGDRLAVTGTFHRVDDVSGEVAVLAVQTGEVVRPGGTLTDPALPDRRLTAAILALVAAVVIGLERWVNRG